MSKESLEFFDKKLRKIAEKDGSLEKRIFSRPALTDLVEKIHKGKIKKVHMTGVGGTAMSSLAGLFATSGYKVSGSDNALYPPTSDLVKELGIKFFEGFSEENIKNKDLVIVANMFGPDNTEAKSARENNLPEMSMPEAIREFFIRDRKSVVLCGTHGKTTTTGLTAHVFLSAGFNPGFLVGGVAVPTDNGIKETSFNAGNFSENKNIFQRLFGTDKLSIASNKPSSKTDSKTKHFIIEGDEYDTSYFDKAPKFLHYKPDIAVITSLEFDHADIYDNYEEYKQSFIFLAKEMPDKGLFILNGDSGEVRSLAQFTKPSVNVLYYGFSENCDITAKDIKVDELGQHFTLIYKGQSLGQFIINLFGKYNLANALAVCAIALNENISKDELRKGLKTFLGMKRRQEIKAVVNGVTIIDDFAHHPTAVRETLSGIRERFPNRRIIALFEPRSSTSRKKIFEHEYGKSFDNIDALYLSMPALREHDNPADFIDGNLVVNDVKTLKMAQNIAKNISENKSVEDCFEAHCVSNGDEALKMLTPNLNKGENGDIVVIMSNGSFDGIHQKLIDAIS